MTRVLVSARVIDKQVGGNTRYARTLYDGLSEFGVDHILGRPPRIPRIPRSAVYAAYEGVFLPLRPPKDVDVVHFPADTGALLSASVPLVGTIHGLATLHVPHVRTASADRIWRYRVMRLAKVATRIITISDSSARDIASVAPEAAGKIVKILHGIDHGKFRPEEGSADAAELESLQIDGPYFLYLGNLDPRKNLVELCRAAQIVHQKTGIPLLISGAPAWDSDAIMQTITTTPGVRYLGRVSDEAMLPLLRAATAFCFPSTYEGFGFPVVEAQACGTPVVCSDRGSLAEIAGDSALIVKELDGPSIAREMLRVLDEPSLAGELRRRGIANAARFQWHESISAHAEVFKEASR
ncbi:Glycosyltransferase involved in cell wall bisynthesis [Rathayibacter oskolensis]|uniref:Glycosyltransferase involved in cell wall bisynthesis n=1 Tax=Rathayibacter oskolensis TaxID=1891671 RepID=A0A1X7NAS4_9MICO|nr:glycosyltransferase family 1 protein [Rathayibacter oskolensis]SMH34704.1 Glycosyltransferase involved in cell wall bisynthesis [Rathayibacter oskolensis]